MKQELQIRLRNLFVELYPDLHDLQRVAHDAGVAVERVTLSGNAVNDWDRLLREATKNQQVADLLDVARQEYGRNQQLHEAYAALVATFEPAPSPLFDNTLPDKGLYLLNFGRELTSKQRQQIEQRLGERAHQVISVPLKFDDERPFGPQCIARLDQLEWTAQIWETRPLLVIPPGYAPAALTLISLIHGRRGHFPAMARLRPETTGVTTDYVLAEIVNLQALRNAAHEQGNR